jgi:S-adenosylmethionine synthetase
MDLVIRPLSSDSGPDVEIVEHKGIGHPDTICDALADAFGVALARYYLERFGTLMHFNVDKALLAGGESRPAFGGGEVTSPIRVFLAGRATRKVHGVRIPVDEIAVETSKAWVRKHLHALDPERHVAWSCLARSGSRDLTDLFLARGAGQAAPWLANDTSIGAGYAPLSPLERSVLAAADRLRELARERPEIGEDVKVMAVRLRDRYELTVACALVGAHVHDLDDYAARRADVARQVQTAAAGVLGRDVAVEVNAADDLAARRIYLTVTGTSAEAGDDGEVGRGNRVNRLITPYRPMSMEAAAGKNPVSHVGKLYSIAAHRMAAAIVGGVPEVAEAYCVLVSRIGRRVDDPVAVDVRLRTREGAPLEPVRARVAAVVEEGLASLGTLAEDVVAGRATSF